MSITLNWANRNVSPLDNINVYRTIEKGDPAPTLLATIAGDATHYTDTTAEYNKFYYYQLGSVKNSEETKSTFIPAIVYRGDDNGPGGQEVLRGDWEFGFMGEVASSLLPSYDEINLASKVVKNGLQPTVFYKWVIRGRIVYVSTIPYHTAITAANVGVMLVKPNKDAEQFRLARGQYEFAIRPPYLTTARDTLIETGVNFAPVWGMEETNQSEVGAIIRSCENTVTKTVGFSYYDAAQIPTANATLLSNTYRNGTELLWWYSNNNNNPAAGGSGVACFIPVYELMFN